MFCCHYRWNAYGDLIHSAILRVVEKGVVSVASPSGGTELTFATFTFNIYSSPITEFPLDFQLDNMK